MSPDYILFAIAILDACMYMVRKNANAQEFVFRMSIAWSGEREVCWSIEI